MHSEPGSPRQKYCDYILAVAFVVFVCLYLELRIEPRLAYDAQCPPFYTGKAFFLETIARAGGLIRYPSAFLSQFLRFPWAGSLLIAVTIALTCTAARFAFKRLSGVTTRVLHCVPGLFLLAAHGNYGYPLEISLGVLTSLIVFAVLARFVPRHPIARLAVLLVATPLLYIAVGGPFIVFATFWGTLAWAQRRHAIAGTAALLGCLVYAAFIPWLCAALVFDVPTSTAYARMLPQLWDSGMSVSILMLYVFLLPAGLAHSITSAPTLRDAGPQKPEAASSFLGRLALFGENARHSRVLHPAVILTLGVLVVVLFFDTDAKALVKLDYYARNKMWPEVLVHARQYPRHPVIGMQDLSRGDETLSAIHDIDRALYHTGRLPYDMFSYPQLSSLALLLSDEQLCLRFRKVNLQRADLLFELGRRNESEHMAYEAWAYFGDRPEIFKQLVRVNLLKERPVVTRTYLGLLQKTLFDREWASQYLHAVEGGAVLAADPVLEHAQAVAIDTDYVGTTVFGPQEAMLVRTLRESRRNRMAYEYLMAFYLLSREPGKVAGNLGGLDAFGYRGIPRHYEEAVLFYMAQTGSQAVNLYGRQISPETQRRFHDFQQIVARHGNNEDALWNALVPRYGNTYWFYDLFGVTGFGEQSVPGPIRTVYGAAP